MFLFTCRGFCLTLHKELKMNYIFVHVGQLVIALISVHWCLCLSDPEGFLYLPCSFIWLFIKDFRSLPDYMVFSRCTCTKMLFVIIRTEEVNV